MTMKQDAGQSKEKGSAKKGRCGTNRTGGAMVRSSRLLVAICWLALGWKLLTGCALAMKLVVASSVVERSCLFCHGTGGTNYLDDLDDLDNLAVFLESFGDHQGRRMTIFKATRGGRTLRYATGFSLTDCR